MRRKNFNFTYTQIIALSFMTVILTGSLLLNLPFSSSSGEYTNIIDSVFTATSATCVTGLVIFDTYSHWSILSVIASSRNNNNIVIYKKRLESSILKHASSIVTIYMMAVLISTLIICAIETFPFKDVLFEVVSAIGTVGLSMGITPALSYASKIIIMILMYGGRAGGLTLMLVLAEKKQNIPLDRPYEKILIG